MSNQGDLFSSPAPEPEPTPLDRLNLERIKTCPIADLISMWDDLTAAEYRTIINRLFDAERSRDALARSRSGGAVR